jgi:hypothetical protein
MSFATSKGLSQSWVSTASNAHVLQVAIHAIGDAANDQILSMYEAVESTNGPRDRRFRVICKLFIIEPCSFSILFNLN